MGLLPPHFVAPPQRRGGLGPPSRLTPSPNGGQNPQWGSPRRPLPPTHGAAASVYSGGEGARGAQPPLPRARPNHLRVVVLRAPKGAKKGAYFFGLFILCGKAKKITLLKPPFLLFHIFKTVEKKI